MTKSQNSNQKKKVKMKEHEDFHLGPKSLGLGPAWSLGGNGIEACLPPANPAPGSLFILSTPNFSTLNFLLVG